MKEFLSAYERGPFAYSVLQFRPKIIHTLLIISLISKVPENYPYQYNLLLFEKKTVLPELTLHIYTTRHENSCIYTRTNFPLTDISTEKQNVKTTCRHVCKLHTQHNLGQQTKT